MKLNSSPLKNILQISLMIFSLRVYSQQFTVAYSAKVNDKREIFIADDQGDIKKKIVSLTNDDGYPSWSPDKKKIAFYGKYDNRKTWSIHTVNSDGSDILRLTHGIHKLDSSPTWSLDSKNIIFAREYQNHEGIWQDEMWIMNTNGSNQQQIKTLTGGGPSYISQNKIIYHCKFDNYDICIADVNGTTIQRLTTDTYENLFPDMSPNAKEIVFMSDRDGNREIYKMNVDGSQLKRLTFNTVDDWNPKWTSDGKSIIFSQRNNEGYMDLYKMNSDGSELQLFIKQGAQPSYR